MNDAPRGVDETRYTLVEHLTELRGRLLKSVLAVFITTGVALAFAPTLLDYTIAPLSSVLRDRNRVETVIVHTDDSKGNQLEARLREMGNVRLVARYANLSDVRALVERRVEEKDPIDLVLVSASTLGDTTALASDLLEGVEPVPDVAYLITDLRDPIVQELQLEGAALIPDPPRSAALARVVRRAAAASGKAATGDKLVVLSPLDPFFAYMKIALVIGLFLACPIWLYQAWQFVAPGLYANEKLILAPVILSASLLFIGGGLFAYFVMFPVMFDVLVNEMMPASLIGTFTVDKYLSLLMTLTIAFGVVFELPLALAVLAAVGVVTPTLLRKTRKFAIVGSFIFAAVVTPTTDPISLLMMAIPLCLFYELGILLAAIVHRRREEKIAALTETT
jgi:sec-independent protein translocase protein TatC